MQTTTQAIKYHGGRSRHDGHLPNLRTRLCRVLCALRCGSLRVHEPAMVVLSARAANAIVGMKETQVADRGDCEGTPPVACPMTILACNVHKSRVEQCVMPRVGPRCENWTRVHADDEESQCCGTRPDGTAIYSFACGKHDLPCRQPALSLQQVASSLLPHSCMDAGAATNPCAPSASS